MKQLLAELMGAKDDGSEFLGHYVEGGIIDTRELIRREAADIRFAAKFPDLLGRLESGAIIDYTDANKMPIAMCRMLPEMPESRWRTVEMISTYVPHRKEYLDLERCRDDVKAEVWRPWKAYVLAADKERKDILAGKTSAPAPPVKPAPSAIAAAQIPPKPAKPAPPPVIKPAEPPPMMVHELQRILRGRRP